MSKRDRDSSNTLQTCIAQVQQFLHYDVAQTNYSCTGVIKDEAPTLTIDDQLVITYPLTGTVVEQLLAKSSVAPIGVGTQVSVSVCGKLSLFTLMFSRL
jgi:hypothetical protein